MNKIMAVLLLGIMAGCSHDGGNPPHGAKPYSTSHSVAVPHREITPPEQVHKLPAPDPNYRPLPAAGEAVNPHVKAAPSRRERRQNRREQRRAAFDPLRPDPEVRIFSK